MRLVLPVYVHHGDDLDIDLHENEHALQTLADDLQMRSLSTIWKLAFCLGYNRLIVHCLEAFTTGHMIRTKIKFDSQLCKQLFIVACAKERET